MNTNYSFIESLSDPHAKEFATLALNELKLKNIKSLEDARSLPAHSMFGHRKLDTDWCKNAVLLETIPEGLVTRYIYDTKNKYPLTTEERKLFQLVEGLKLGKFSFYFTFSEDYKVIFCSVISTGLTNTTPYVLKVITENTNTAFSYFQKEYKKPDDDAIYRVMSRVVTTDLLQEWTNEKKGSHEMFTEKILPGCNWEKNTILRFFNEGEL